MKSFALTLVTLFGIMSVAQATQEPAESAPEARALAVEAAAEEIPSEHKLIQEEIQE